LALAFIFSALYIGVALSSLLHDYRIIESDAAADARSMNSCVQGCNEIQGYLISKPLAAEEIEAQLVESQVI
jgi:hypothetical protein